MQLGAGVRGPGQAAAAEADGRHARSTARTPAPAGRPPPSRPRTASGWRGRSTSRCRSRRSSDDPRELEPGLQLLERQPVGRVAVDLVGGAEDERRVGAVRARRLEQVEGAVGVDAEVGLRVARGPVVRGLGGGVDDDLDRARACSANSRSTPSASRMSSSVGAELRELAARASSVTGAVDASGPKKRAAHVVLDPDHVEALRDQVAHGLRADQAAGAGDDRDPDIAPIKMRLRSRGSRRGSGGARGRRRGR